MFDPVPSDAISNPATIPMSSPCKMHMFLPGMRRTSVDGPVKAAVTDSMSHILLTTSTIALQDTQLIHQLDGT